MSSKLNEDAVKVYSEKLKKMVPMIGKIITTKRSPFQTSSFGAIKRLGVVKKESDGRYLVTEKAKKVTGRDIAIQMQKSHGHSKGAVKSKKVPTESAPNDQLLDRIDQIDGKFDSVLETISRRLANMESFMFRAAGGAIK